ncbi:hypothetical protein PFAG_03901 [Plasmodium falciparum Santa Lucia]|uniref:Uncharacterized protein n=1 Tax=Plasmodium falciparum Santa Lucia TaxID=478859 RepID=W7FEY8_PLAFA|nr:hypothetical protein PFAG_03901 [Plasmodium falciparum Santa Lucia]
MIIFMITYMIIIMIIFMITYMIIIMIIKEKILNHTICVSFDSCMLRRVE